MTLSSILPSVDSFGPEAALFLFAGWLAWEVYAPRVLNVDTAFSPLFEMPERMEDVEEQLDNTACRVEDIEEQQTHHIQATRANARALDEERSVTIDSRRIDQYLIQNGVPASAFIRGGDDKYTEQDSQNAEQGDDQQRNVHT